jgi:hypothetical protein
MEPGQRFGKRTYRIKREQLGGASCTTKFLTEFGYIVDSLIFIRVQCAASAKLWRKMTSTYW